MKKTTSLLVLCLILAVMLSACFDSPDFSPSSTGNEPEITETNGSEQESEGEKVEEPSLPEKSIDIYIIAGQSNGAGYTKYNASELEELWPQYMEGAQNVLYSGRAAYIIGQNTPNASTESNVFIDWIPTRAGMGKSSSHMGPEVGMAAYLSKYYYNEENGNKTAGILKYAHGGTSLFDNKEGGNATSGNWVSPSYAEALGVAHTGLTGGLYKELTSQIKVSLAKLERQGYTDVNIKGIFWMQGEADKKDPSEYKKALKFFIDDIRSDIGEIVGEDLSELAFMVGEISRTSGSAKASTISVNEKFIAMQRQLENEISNVYVIESGKFDVNWLDENGNNKNGQDAWHWTTADMFAIGELVGECIVTDILGANQ